MIMNNCRRLPPVMANRNEQRFDYQPNLRAYDNNFYSRTFFPVLTEISFRGLRAFSFSVIRYVSWYITDTILLRSCYDLTTIGGDDVVRVNLRNNCEF